MRVTIEHREVQAGVSGKQRQYFVDCTVDFSQEERAIINARGLQKHTFVLAGAAPPRTGTNFIGAGALRGFAPLIGVGGFVFGIFGGGAIAFLMIVAAIAMWVTGFVMDRREPGDAPPQEITVKQLLSSPRFTVYARDPAAAKISDDIVRSELVNLKNLIAESAEVRARQTFEL